jgi:hypothetical protein
MPDRLPCDLPDELPEDAGARPVFRSVRGAGAAKAFAGVVPLVPDRRRRAASPFWQGFRWGLIGTSAVVIATLAAILTADLVQRVLGGGG